MNKDELCVIPRNLNEPDKAFHIMNKGLTWKQLGYVGIGAMGAYALCHVGAIPVAAKIAGSIMSIGLASIVSTTRFKGQELDELAKNAVIYGQRKVYYYNVRKAMNSCENQYWTQSTATGFRSVRAAEVPQGVKDLGV